ncbi:hypothetical protein CFC21_056348 [Triticum aestivum]|uniref:Myb/SANT-like DNA-binding domain-containing protein n=3 Tax=Triticum TaxID=4564 RepID=A0A9R0T8X4_TRITD|nr:trihelix transcription factor ASIL1-like [Triticum dicoccoides]XP_044372719.1 trihelix transcription factor ASIL1-like [Triticum aestivum]KAF7047415.1 hypothetical protein CFC21_056348 [Triticum aestivum]VAI06677.1 unnamed protein product [Triticum turgidum subsp. durum]
MATTLHSHTLSPVPSPTPAGRSSDMHWSDEETSVLVDAWGPLYLGRNRGSLSMEDWDSVCSAVDAHHAAAGLDFKRNPAGCKRRIFTLKARYTEEAAKGQPTSAWRHFAHLRAYLADPSGGPPGFAAKTSVKKEKKVEEGSGSVGTTKVPAKRRFSSLRDILAKTPATVKEEEVVGCGCELVGGPPAGVTKLVAEMRRLAEVHERVEMERHKFMKEMLKMKMKEEMETEDVKLEHKKVKVENEEQVHGN